MLPPSLGELWRTSRQGASQGEHGNTEINQEENFVIFEPGLWPSLNMTNPAVFSSKTGDIMLLVVSSAVIIKCISSCSQEKTLLEFGSDYT